MVIFNLENGIDFRNVLRNVKKKNTFFIDIFSILSRTRVFV
jgi:hypothetical protein